MQIDKRIAYGQCITDSDLLKGKAIRITAPRLLVLRALKASQKPMTPQKIVEALRKREDSVNLVTVYRILEMFEEQGIVHRQPSTGDYLLCTLPGQHGHHGLLHCLSCGHIEEFHDPALCRIEDTIAKRAGFRASEHRSEIVGTCKSCS